MLHTYNQHVIVKNLHHYILDMLNDISIYNESVTMWHVIHVSDVQFLRLCSHE